ncbi:hypothetical protein ACIBF5_30035 [Micromonospora sp. NPDC050417]|uniref:hypothetical protein n=1 Tax=Micromonospora sp. NPDC050417 TaxID=3364280 RepID=UPI0037B76335
MRNRTDQPRVHGYDRVTLIVRGNAMPPELTPARLPRERDRHTVIVAADPPLDLPTLTALLSHHLPVRCASIRLVLSEAGRVGIAQVIADELRIEVLAPAGPVMLLPSGMLFVTEGQWWRFRPGEAGERQGARQPAPDWERLLPLHPRVLPSEMRATAVPAGLWLHDAEPPVPPLTAALLSLPVDPERPTVVIGRPAGAPLPPEPVYAMLEALPRTLRRRMVLVPYGAEGGTADTVGEWLAARTGGTIDVVGGVSEVGGVDGGPVPADADDRRRWRPFARRLVYRAGATPQVTQWRDPLPGAPGTAGVQRVDPDWAVEVIRAGLWLRSADDDSEQDVIRRLPIDDRHPLLVLGAAAVERPHQALTVLDTVVDRLPVDTTGVLRLAVTRPPDEGDVALWVPLVERYGPLLAVVGPGHLVELPSRPIAVSEPVPVPASEPVPVPASEPVPVPVAELTSEPEPGPIAETITVPVAETITQPIPILIPTPIPEPKAIPEPVLSPLPGAGRVPQPAYAPGPEMPSGLEPAPEPVTEPPANSVAARQDDVPARPDVDGGRYTGAVFTDWRFEPMPDWGPGQELHTPETLIGTTTPHPSAPEGPAPAGPELVIWSVTGQRATDTGSQTGQQVRFAPGSRVRVVEVEHLGHDEPVLVLLRDITPDPAYDVPEPGHDEVLDRRARSALRRAVDAVRRTPATSDWPFSPGRGYRASR